MKWIMIIGVGYAGRATTVLLRQPSTHYPQSPEKYTCHVRKITNPE